MEEWKMERICNVTAEALAELSEIAKSVTSTSTDVCPVDTALSIVKKAKEVSCGSGVYCRDGMNQLIHTIEDITAGAGQPEDIDTLQEICDAMMVVADCDLSYTAAELVKGLITEHTDEWEAHIKRKRCKALICRGGYTLHVAPDKCDGCGKCAEVCSYKAIAGGENMIHVIDIKACKSCAKCEPVCPKKAIVRAGAVKPMGPTAPIAVGSWAGAGAGGEGGGRRRRRG
jgi:NADH-quinone oxidoreductase subunit F